MLAQAVHDLPEATQSWLYELKLDGYRCIAVKKAARKAQLFSRNQNLFDLKFPAIVTALHGIEPETVLDGEIVALDEKGRPSFSVLQNSRVVTTRIYFYVFDLLIYQGRSLLMLPVEARRALLKPALHACPDTIRLSQNLPGSAKKIIRAAEQLGLEALSPNKGGPCMSPTGIAARGSNIASTRAKS